MSEASFDYTQRGNAAFEKALHRRSAARDAAFFLPHLTPSMKLLDLGCGVGSISLGLARALVDGELVGVDRQPEQVAAAARLAVEQGVANATFQVADAHALPFEDGSFDAVFAHAVLMHLREPARALRELRRIVRRGGIIGVRDPDMKATLRAPTTPRTDAWSKLARRVARKNGSHPYLGRTHRQLLLDAGFGRTVATASVTVSGTSESVRETAEFLEASAIGVARTAIAQGWTDAATAEAVIADLQAWAQRPDAFYSATWCEAVGWVED